MKIKKNSKWTLGLSVVVLALMMLSVSASGGNDLGTSPFDFSDATYRAHGIVPENIVLRVGTSSRTGDFVVDNTNTDPNRANVRTIETTRHDRLEWSNLRKHLRRAQLDQLRA